MAWEDYWAKIAVKLKARKDELGRKMPDKEIAAHVESVTGKASDRALVNHWLLGRREPYISQFFALCDKLGLSPNEVLEQSRHVRSRTPLREINEKAKTQHRIPTIRRRS